MRSITKSVIVLFALFPLIQACGSDSGSTQTPASTPENTTAACSDNIDNDQNGLTDCDDPNCKYFKFCAESVAGKEDTLDACTDKLDNDGDSFIDCDDQDCQSLTICQKEPPAELKPENTEEACSDKIDNDGDTLIDCFDNECKDFDHCKPPVDKMPENTEENCSDTVDNDDNGLTDCEETACKAFAHCQKQIVPENTEETCADEIDNDGDDLIDCEDSDCKDTKACAIPENTEETCSDNLDNDGDELIDCEDPDCESTEACAIPPENTPEACEDGIDNDKDGYIDCKDPDCQETSVCSGECYADPEKWELDEHGCRCYENWDEFSTQCFGAEDSVRACIDGIDNDQDGKVDCEDPSCQKLTTVCLGACSLLNDYKEDVDEQGCIKCYEKWDEHYQRCMAPENTEVACSDGVDNDNDRLVDCYDESCFETEHCKALDECPNQPDRILKDPGCECYENYYMDLDACFAEEDNDITCSDGRDNDLDGNIDCLDLECMETDYCKAHNQCPDHKYQVVKHEQCDCGFIWVESEKACFVPIYTASQFENAQLNKYNYILMEDIQPKSSGDSICTKIFLGSNHKITASLDRYLFGSLYKNCKIKDLEIDLNLDTYYAKFANNITENSVISNIKGKITQNFKSSKPEDNEISLFANSLSDNATVQNIDLEIDASISLYTHRMNICGLIRTLSDGTLSNVSVSGKLYASNTYINTSSYSLSKDSVAGVVCSITHILNIKPININNITSTVDIQLDEANSDAEVYIGGIAGDINHIELQKISNLKFQGSLTFNQNKVNRDVYIGGIAGVSTSSIDDAYADVSLTLSDMAINSDYKVYIAGIVGQTQQAKDNYDTPMWEPKITNSAARLELYKIGNIVNAINASNYAPISLSAITSKLPDFNIGIIDGCVGKLVFSQKLNKITHFSPAAGADTNTGQIDHSYVVGKNYGKPLSELFTYSLIGLGPTSTQNTFWQKNFFVKGSYEVDIIDKSNPFSFGYDSEMKADIPMQDSSTKPIVSVLSTGKTKWAYIKDKDNSANLSGTTMLPVPENLVGKIGTQF